MPRRSRNPCQRASTFSASPPRRSARLSTRPPSTSSPSHARASPSLPQPSSTPFPASDDADGTTQLLFFSHHTEWRHRAGMYVRDARGVQPDLRVWGQYGATTLRYPPAKLASTWRLLLEDALLWVSTSPDNDVAWLWLFLLPILALVHDGSTLSTRRTRLRHILHGNFAEVGVYTDDLNARRLHVHDSFGDDRRAAQESRCLRLARCGRLSAAVKALLSDRPLPHTDLIWSSAEACFPAASTSLPQPAPFLPLLQEWSSLPRESVSRTLLPTELRAEADVRPLIYALPKGSAAGPSGLRAEHLYGLSATGLSSLASVLNLLLRGEPSSSVVWSLLARSKLVLLAKKGHVADAPRVRPIGVPEVFRRLASKALLQLVRSRSRQFFAPVQLGISVPGGCEAVNLAVRSHLQHAPEAGALFLDFRNAFNEISRRRAFSVLEAVFPELHPFLRSVYSCEETGPLYLGHVDAAGLPRMLFAREGVQQGDTLGPLLHACGLQLALKGAEEEFQRRQLPIRLLAYHDDVTLLGPPDALAQGLRIMTTYAKSVNLTLQTPKCEFLAPTLRSTAVPSSLLPLAVAEGAVHHSIPYGSSSFIHARLVDLLAEHRRLTEALLRLPHAEAQTVLVLLRFCCGPRLTYWLRSLPFLWAEWLAQEADRSSFGDLDRFVDSFGVVFDSVDGRRLRAQLALPPSRGGLGLCGRHLLVPAAQVAAWSNVLRILGCSSPDLSSLRTSLCEHEYSPSLVIRSRCAVPISLCAPTYFPAVGIATELRLAMAHLRELLRLPVDPRSSLLPGRPRLSRAGQFASWHVLLDTSLDLPRAAAPAVDSITATLTPQSLTALGSTPLVFLQHLFTQEIYQEEFSQLLRISPLMADRARLLSVSADLGALWVSAIPSQPRFRMSGAEVRLALRVFLGLPMPTIARQYSVACPHYGCREVSVDGYGHHFLAACPGGARLRTSLHHSLVKVLQRTLSTAGYIVAREPPLAEFLASPNTTSSSTPAAQEGSGLRPDLLVSSTTGLRDIYVDVSVICPLRSSLLERTSSSTAAAASVRRSSKIRKYDARVRQSVPSSSVGLAPSFAPLVFESFGAMDAACSRWLRSLFSPAQEVLLQDLRLHFSVLLWRFNASHLLHAVAALHRSRPSRFPTVYRGLFPSAASSGS